MWRDPAIAGRFIDGRELPREIEAPLVKRESEINRDPHLIGLGDNAFLLEKNALVRIKPPRHVCLASEADVGSSAWHVC
jgi:hypothetical protein